MGGGGCKSSTDNNRVCESLKSFGRSVLLTHLETNREEGVGRERHTQRDRDRETETETERQRQRQTDRNTQTDRQIKTDGHREKRICQTNVDTMSNQMSAEMTFSA